MSRRRAAALALVGASPVAALGLAPRLQAALGGRPPAAILVTTASPPADGPVLSLRYADGSEATIMTTASATFGPLGWSARIRATAPATAVSARLPGVRGVRALLSDGRIGEHCSSGPDYSWTIEPTGTVAATYTLTLVPVTSC